MKFQNPSMHGSAVMLCIKKRTDGRMDVRTNVPEAICPSNFFEDGDITRSENETTMLFFKSENTVSFNVWKYLFFLFISDIR